MLLENTQHIQTVTLSSNASGTGGAASRAGRTNEHRHMVTHGTGTFPVAVLAVVCCVLGLLVPAAYSPDSTLCFLLVPFPVCLIFEIKRCLLYKQKHDAMTLGEKTVAAECIGFDEHTEV